MISLSTLVSGSDIARGMSDDMEESALFFPIFAASLSEDDWTELTEMFGDDRKEKVKRLGELLIKAAE